MANNPRNHVMNAIFHGKDRVPNPGGGPKSKEDPVFHHHPGYDSSGNSTRPRREIAKQLEQGPQGGSAKLNSLGLSRPVPKSSSKRYISG